MSKLFKKPRGYLRYWPLDQPFPKEEKWVCRCGGKFKTRNAMHSHILSRDGRSIDFNHGFSHIMKHGTVYNDVLDMK